MRFSFKFNSVNERHRRRPLNFCFILSWSNTQLWIYHTYGLGVLGGVRCDTFGHFSQFYFSIKSETFTYLRFFFVLNPQLTTIPKMETTTLATSKVQTLIETKIKLSNDMIPPHRQPKARRPVKMKLFVSTSRSTVVAEPLRTDRPHILPVNRLLLWLLVPIVPWTMADANRTVPSCKMSWPDRMWSHARAGTATH